MEKVIILHGLGRTSTSMRYLARKVEEAGYDAILIDYPSHEKTIENMVEHLIDVLPEGSGKLNFIGHSLGGILAIRVAKKLPNERRGKIVQLGSPNLGTEMSERMAVLGKIVGPVFNQLSPHECEDTDGLDIGAIAGTAAIAAYGLITGIEGENDGKVSVESAWGNAPEEKRIALPTAHSLMMWDKRVIEASIEFLDTGTFKNHDHA